jgi:oxalate decarboxylase/phosphoglucose isomerase-like protein (cupin superfamily)
MNEKQVVKLYRLMNTVYDARIIGLPKIEDPRGNLSIIEQIKQIPFEIRRTYWIYDVPGGKNRGGHAYKENQEFIVALSGSFDVVLDDGKNIQTFPLNRSYCGLYVPKGMWRTMTNFSTNSLALVLSSTEYDENDYIMNYDEYLKWRKDPSYQTASSDSKTSFKEREGKSMFLAGEGKSVFDCSLCELNKMHDPEGNLTYMYENVHVPFPINRVFYSYDIPGGEDRGAHAHKECHQFIIAASGSFEVVLDDGINKRTVQLNRPFWGLHVPPGIWASEQGFSSGSICLVLASHGYSEDDYIRNYDDFQEYVKSK